MTDLMLDKCQSFEEAQSLALRLAEQYGETFHVIESRGTFYTGNGETELRGLERLRGYAKPILGKRAKWYARP